MALGKRVSKSRTLTHSGRTVMRTIWEDIWRTPSTHSLPCCSPKYRRALWVEPERYDRWPGATGHPIGVPMTVRVASCSCGQLRAEVRGEPTGVSVCHCHACQRRTGSVFGAQARFPREAVAMEGDGTEFVRVGEEGGRFRFTFCPRCGSTASTSRKGTNERSPSPWGPSRTRASRPPRSPSTRIAGTLGSPFPTMPSTGAGPGLKRPHPRPTRAAREGAGWQGRARPDT